MRKIVGMGKRHFFILGVIRHILYNKLSATNNAPSDEN